MHSPRGAAVRGQAGARGAGAARGAVRAVVLVATAVTVLAALAGCNLVGSSSTPKPKATSTTSSALDALVPSYPSKLTAATAKSGTVEVADSIQSLIASTDIVNVDNTSKLVAADGKAGSFYGVERAVTTSTGFGVIEQGQAMEKLLVQAGWTARQTNSATSTYTVAMSIDTKAGTAVLLLDADETPKAPPAIVIELESPDLPR